MEPAPVPAGPTVTLRPVDAATVRVVALHRVARKGGELGIAFAHGSAVVIDRAGWAITASHVIEDASVLAVLLPGEDDARPAVEIERIADRDLGLIRFAGGAPTALEIRQGRDIALGQQVHASGYPLDPRERWPAAAVGQIARPLNDGRLQLSISLNPGNSGGPVVDDAGALVGIVTRGPIPEKARRALLAEETDASRADAAVIAAATGVWLNRADMRAVPISAPSASPEASEVRDAPEGRVASGGYSHFGLDMAFDDHPQAEDSPLTAVGMLLGFGLRIGARPGQTVRPLAVLGLEGTVGLWRSTLRMTGLAVAGARLVVGGTGGGGFVELAWTPGYILAEDRTASTWAGYRLSAGARQGRLEYIISWSELGRQADSTLRTLGLSLGVRRLRPVPMVRSGRGGALHRPRRDVQLAAVGDERLRLRYERPGGQVRRLLRLRGVHHGSRLPLGGPGLVIRRGALLRRARLLSRRDPRAVLAERHVPVIRCPGGPTPWRAGPR